jgi:hypothetical protein
VQPSLSAWILSAACLLPLRIGSEFGLIFSENMSYIGDARDGMFSTGDFPGALTAVLGPTYVEASFPISVLETLTPGLAAFDVIATNDFSEIGTVFLAVPEPPAILLLALALPGLAVAHVRASRTGKRRLVGRAEA